MEMSGKALISKPIDVVFTYVVNLKNDVNWRTGVDESGLRTDPPIGPGSIGYSRAGDQEIEWKVISYIDGERVEWELLSGPYLGRGGYSLESVDGGTQFTLLADIEPTGLFKLMGPLFAWMGRRRNQADVEKLRDILEQ